MDVAQDEKERGNASHWRAQMMRLFWDGGFGLRNAADAGPSEPRRTFVKSRLHYANQLKERFVGSSARFLFQGQDATGIEKLETELIEILDDALRLSCRLWTRGATVHLYGLEELRETNADTLTSLVALCHAQVAVTPQREREELLRQAAVQGDISPRQRMVMLVQPAVITGRINLDGTARGGSSSPTDGLGMVWLKARAMLVDTYLAETTGGLSVSSPVVQPGIEPTEGEQRRENTAGSKISDI